MKGSSRQPCPEKTLFAGGYQAAQQYVDAAPDSSNPALALHNNPSQGIANLGINA
jgi:hypothetical protein